MVCHLAQLESEIVHTHRFRHRPVSLIFLANTIPFVRTSAGLPLRAIDPWLSATTEPLRSVRGGQRPAKNVSGIGEIALRGVDRGASLLSSALFAFDRFQSRIAPEPTQMLLLRKTLEYDAERAARTREGYRQVLRLTHPIKRPIASRSRSATIATNMIEYAQELLDPTAVGHFSMSKQPAPKQRAVSESSVSLRRKLR